MRVEVDADTETPVSAFLKLSRGAGARLPPRVGGGRRAERALLASSAPARAACSAGSSATRGDPVAAVRAALATHRAVRVPGTPRFSGGLVGHLAYDAVRLFEPRVPVAGPGRARLPGRPAHGLRRGGGLRQPPPLAARHLRGALRRGRRPARALRRRGGADPRAGCGCWRGRSPIGAPRRAATPAALVPRVSTRAPSRRRCGRRRRTWRPGTASRIVLSQRFDAETRLPPFEIYRALRRVNPSPYLFFVKDGRPRAGRLLPRDAHQARGRRGDAPAHRRHPPARRGRRRGRRRSRRSCAPTRRRTPST